MSLSSEHSALAPSRHTLTKSPRLVPTTSEFFAFCGTLSTYVYRFALLPTMVTRSSSTDKRPPAKGVSRSTSKSNLLKQNKDFKQTTAGRGRSLSRSHSTSLASASVGHPMEVDDPTTSNTSSEPTSTTDSASLSSSPSSSSVPTASASTSVSTSASVTSSESNPASSPHSASPSSDTCVDSSASAVAAPPTASSALSPSQVPHSPPRTLQESAESSQATPPHHNRSPATRKHKIYFRLQVTPAKLPSDKKATGALKLEAYRQGLVKVIEALVSIDDTLAFWPYEFPNSPESELLNNPSALGSSIHQILKFFDEFRINKFLSMSYVNCLIGFNMDYALFMLSAGVMLEDLPARIDKRSLQVPHITPLGWLFGSHEDVSIPVLEQVLNDAVSRLAPNQVPAIQFGLSFRPIWDGVSNKEKKKEQDRTKWAVHVEAIAEIALTSKAFL